MKMICVASFYQAWDWHCQCASIGEIESGLHRLQIILPSIKESSVLSGSENRPKVGEKHRISGEVNVCLFVRLCCASVCVRMCLDVRTSVYLFVKVKGKQTKVHASTDIIIQRRIPFYTR